MPKKTESLGREFETLFPCILTLSSFIKIVKDNHGVKYYLGIEYNSFIIQIISTMCSSIMVNALGRNIDLWNEAIASASGWVSIEFDML